MSGPVRIIVIIIVVLIIIAIIAAIVRAASKKKKERDRELAGGLREHAAQQAAGVKQREAQAKETEAEAAAARAEADRKQAQAERLEAESQERQQRANAARDEHQDRLRKADELDPDVNTRSESYTGPDPTGHADHDARPEHSEHGVGTPTTEGDPATITHPDGSTEAVNEPGTDGGSHLA